MVVVVVVVVVIAIVLVRLDRGSWPAGRPAGWLADREIAGRDQLAMPLRQETSERQDIDIHRRRKKDIRKMSTIRYTCGIRSHGSGWHGPVRMIIDIVRR